ncbi:hypothetical protein [Aporhodopirellula aestuarii]|uniref:Secreted protein n=1 Tax=Aporhodopirellula aestuarii TaxID=2950107 RepID=A0ABT0U6T6_9BACT|nr:hypothetical protein [Aporhodopirellula aestuarii]MCM2372601.1 hypothetical protein [Aporhodopirellula aestuarii]
MSVRSSCLSIVFVCIAFVGCGGESNSVISPPEGAREMTPEEIAEFNANAADDMQPVIQD